MTTRIFFVVRQDNPDNEPVVVAEIYRDSGFVGNLVAEHVMTIEGAEIRMSDMQTAIQAAKNKRDNVHCTGCGSTSHSYNDCPDEATVYAVKVNGEEYRHVADTLADVSRLVDTEQSYGQCLNCGSFNEDGSLAAFTIQPGLFNVYRAVCGGCKTSYNIVAKRTKEVCF